MADNKWWSHLRRIYDALPKKPRCRDCADHDGTCPASGYPCDPTDEVIVRLKAAQSSTPVSSSAVKEEYYKCYSCKQVFTDDGLARQHFGSHLNGDLPKCVAILNSNGTIGGGHHDPYVRVRKDHYNELVLAAAPVPVSPDRGLEQQAYEIAERIGIDHSTDGSHRRRIMVDVQAALLAFRAPLSPAVAELVKEANAAAVVFANEECRGGEGQCPECDTARLLWRLATALSAQRQGDGE